MLIRGLFFAVMTLVGMTGRGQTDSIQAEVVIYGSSPAAFTAAIEAQRLGKTAVIVAPETRLGGLTTGGLGQTDIGNKSAFGGLALQFYRDIADYYKDPAHWTYEKRGDYVPDGQCAGSLGTDSMWTFEPHAALAVLTKWEHQHQLKVYRGEFLDREKGVTKTDGRIRSIRTLSGKTFVGQMFVDATYEGDLMAAAGVSYTVGREANAVYGETISGIEVRYARHHQFVQGVDPYVVKGDPSSGLLPGVEPYNPQEKDGDGDQRVQAYCFRMCLTDDPTNRIPFAKPANYDPKNYELLLRNLEGLDPQDMASKNHWRYMPWINSRMPNRKTDTNNRTGFSTDFIGQNWAWPEASYAERAKILKAHLDYQRGLMWTLANHPRVPAAIRDEVARWGTCKDEFLDGLGDGWQSQLYVREARRLVGETVMTEHHCRGEERVARPVALAAYTMDSHHVRRHVGADGFVHNEGDVQDAMRFSPFGPKARLNNQEWWRNRFPPYGIDYGAIVPKRTECANLFVPVCLSASHMAFGSIRMEPVFFALGQVAGAAAALSLEAGCAVQDLEYPALRAVLTEHGQVLEGPTLVLGERVCGFDVQSVVATPDVGGKLWRLVYAKNGAELLWLERDDDEKAFAIAFRTLPEDDSGVAHILEHSVLCGSEKFPVREPFVELLKSSLATYLNAFTASDLTCYPVSTRSDGDLRNLTEVYLDAVFNPNSMTSDWAFHQEREIVRNEMKGLFATPETLGRVALNRLLYPGRVYSRVSGGDPKAIPALTYAQYQAFYRRHYHPSNARIYLYGNVRILDALEQLDGYLSRYERVEPAAAIPLTAPVTNGAVTVEYPSQELKDRTVLRDGWVFGSFAEREKAEAMAVVAEVLAGFNEAPLTKALLDRGLCEDVGLWSTEGCQNQLGLYVLNVKDGRVAECRQVIRETLERIVREGLDPKALAAKLDHAEFVARSMLDGSGLGLKFLSPLMDAWLYGGEPAEGLQLFARYASLRAKIGTGYYEQLIRETLLDNPHHAEVTLLPVLPPKESEEKATSPVEAPEDTPENLAKLPKLRLKDLPEQGRFPEWSVTNAAGVTIIRPKVPETGISRVTLAFAADCLTATEIADLPLLSAVLGDLATARYSTVELQRELESRLGAFSAYPVAYERGLKFCVAVSFLDTHSADALELVPEILFRTRLDDARHVDDTRRQLKLGAERQLLRGGLIGSRAASGLSRRAQFGDLLSGVAQLRHLQCEARGELAALAKKLFVRDGLTVTIAGVKYPEFLPALLAQLPAKPMEGLCPWLPPPGGAGREGYALPGKVGFTALAMRLPQDVPYDGTFRVGAKILSLDYLWKEIRVKGGAYGGSFRIGWNGEAAFSSWRDPTPAKSFTTFAGAAQALREFAAGEESIEPYQISTLGDLDFGLSVTEIFRSAMGMTLSGRTTAELQRERSAVYRMQRGELTRLAEALERMVPAASRCAAAPETALQECALERIEPAVMEESRCGRSESR